MPRRAPQGPHKHPNAPPPLCPTLPLPPCLRIPLALAWSCIWASLVYGAAICRCMDCFFINGWASAHLCLFLFRVRLRTTQPLPALFFTFNPRYPRLHRLCSLLCSTLGGLFLATYLLAYRNSSPGQDTAPYALSSNELAHIGTLTALWTLFLHYACTALLYYGCSGPYARARYPALHAELARRAAGDSALRHKSGRELVVELGGPCASARLGAHAGHPGLLPPGYLTEKARADARAHFFTAQLASIRGATLAAPLGGGAEAGSGLFSGSSSGSAQAGSVTHAREPLPPMGRPPPTNASYHYGYVPPPMWLLTALPMLRLWWNESEREAHVGKALDRETLALAREREVRHNLEEGAHSSAGGAGGTLLSLRPAHPDALAERLLRAGGDAAAAAAGGKKKRKSGGAAAGAAAAAAAQPPPPHASTLALRKRGRVFRMDSKGPWIFFPLACTPSSPLTIATLLTLTTLCLWFVSYISVFSSTQLAPASAGACAAFLFSTFLLHCFLHPAFLALHLVLQVCLAPLATRAALLAPCSCARRAGERSGGLSMDERGGTSWPLWARLALFVLPRAEAEAQGLPPQAVVLSRNIPLVLAALSDANAPTDAYEHPSEPSWHRTATAEQVAAAEATRRELMRRRYILALLRGMQAAAQAAEGAAAAAALADAARQHGVELVSRTQDVIPSFSWQVTSAGTRAAAAAALAAAAPPPSAALQAQAQALQGLPSLSPQRSISPTGGIRTSQHNPLARSLSAQMSSAGVEQRGFFPIHRAGAGAATLAAAQGLGASAASFQRPPQQRLLSTTHGAVSAGMLRANPLWQGGGAGGTGAPPPNASSNPLMLRAMQKSSQQLE